MSDDVDEMLARHQAILREFQADGVELARELRELAREAIRAKELEAAERLSLAWYRLTRSVRQSLALEARLRRDAARWAQEAEADAERASAVAEGRMRRHVLIVNQLIWTEAEKTQAQDPFDGFFNRRPDPAADEEHAKKIAAIAANPKAYLRWLEERADRTRLQLDMARDTIRRGIRIVGGGDIAELPAHVLPTYGVDPDSS